MAGLVPATHHEKRRLRMASPQTASGTEILGGRDKPGHDDQMG